MSFRISVDPTVEPLSLTEVKNWLKVSATSDDDLITMLLASTRETIEDRLNIRFITQTVEQYSDRIPTSDEIQLDTFPVQSVTSVEYKTGGSYSTFSSDAYTLDTNKQPGRVYLKDSYSWPTTDAEQQAIKITYVAGFGDTAADVPTKYKTLILHAVAYAYENRMNPVQERKTYIDKLIYQHRNWTFE